MFRPILIPSRRLTGPGWDQIFFHGMGWNQISVGWELPVPRQARTGTGWDKILMGWELPSRSRGQPSAVRTVKTLWREWTIGLAGNSSIDMLDSKWSSWWQAGHQSEIQWYSLRLEIIKKIRHIAQTQRTSEKAAMWQINQLQEKINCSLDQLCKQLWADRKKAV